LDAVTRNIQAQHEIGLAKADLNGPDYADLSMLKAAITRIQ